MVQGMQNFIPPANRQRAKGYIQQHGSNAAMLKLMGSVALFESEQVARGQNRELADSCKRLTLDKASLEDEVNPLQSSEMANRVASTESRADELANKVNQLQEELDRVKAEKESGIQAAMDESFGAEWLVGVDMFKDAVAVASMNTTTKIYNNVCGKVLKHRPDFPINELAFFEGEEFDEEGKSLADPVDTTVRLRWELNEERVPIWPPSVLEEGKEFENLPRFDSWVGDAPLEEAEPSSTPSAPQLASTIAIPSPARADASIPVDLTDD
ncbi:hypothetical protein SLEP1_g56183 [Rubroshorea leprosula]|uniref:Uncharacterized protein n=1 Tax=Rubroshorea leprosula TaxID=152421 RepID=A0AAV5MHL5_9ROSI|nr:hypothetical protein SLEP1_g56183 [Rubroshorea leprosula]